MHVWCMCGPPRFPTESVRGTTSPTPTTMADSIRSRGADLYNCPSFEETTSSLRMSSAGACHPLLTHQLSRGTQLDCFHAVAVAVALTQTMLLTIVRRYAESTCRSECRGWHRGPRLAATDPTAPHRALLLSSLILFDWEFGMKRLCFVCLFVCVCVCVCLFVCV